MSLGGDKHLFIALVILVATFRCSLGTMEPNKHDLQVTVRETGESISSRLLQIRHLLTSLFSDWNFGESKLHGPAERTFGRIRIMRKIMLPLAFIGGFMTAVIFSIKFTGLINMLLIKKVLLLQMALILGKLIYGAKELLTAKHSASFFPVYMPSHSDDWHHGSFSHKAAYAAYPDEDYLQQPSYYSRQLAAFQSQPQFNHHTNYPLNYNQPQTNIQPHWHSGQQQTGSFGGIPMQLPQNVQFKQPANQGQSLRFADSHSYESQFNNNVLPYAQPLIGSAQSTIKSLTPQEMTQLLSDAIMQVSSRTTPSPIDRRINFNYRSSRRK